MSFLDNFCYYNTKTCFCYNGIAQDVTTVRSRSIPSLPLDSDWIFLNTGVFYRKIGKIVFVIADSSSYSLSTNNITLGTLPEHFRPSQRICGVGHASGASTTPVNFTIVINGEILAGVSSGTANGIYASVSFPVD